MTIGEARTAYLALRDRARRMAPSSRGYIDLLWSSWDDALGMLPPETSCPPGSEALTAAIVHPRMHADAVIEWLDAYPSGIIDRLPGGVLAP